MSAKIATATGHGEALELTDRADRYDLHSKELSYAVRDASSGSDQEVLEEQDGHLRPTKSSRNDIVGMRRMGKDQQLVRRFRQLSITGFVALATASWEIRLFIFSPGLINGGRAGLLWSALWCWIGFAPIYLSMAETASMAPIAGAQYHWVSEFAPGAHAQRMEHSESRSRYDKILPPSASKKDMRSAHDPFILSLQLRTSWNLF